MEPKLEEVEAKGVRKASVLESEKRETTRPTLKTTKGEEVSQPSKKVSNSSKDIVKVKNPKAGKPVKKAAVKPKKQSIAKFLDEEAEEGEESQEECKNLKGKEAESYSAEFLRAKAERLDKDMVDVMMKKYQDVDDDDEDEMQIVEKREGTE